MTSFTFGLQTCPTLTSVPGKKGGGSKGGQKTGTRKGNGCQGHFSKHNLLRWSIQQKKIAFFFHFQAAPPIVKPASFYGNHFRNGGHNDEVYYDDVNIIRTRQRFCRTVIFQKNVNFLSSVLLCICTLHKSMTAMLPKNDGDDGDAHDDDDDLRKKAKVVQLLLHIPHTAPASGQHTDDHHTTTHDHHHRLTGTNIITKGRNKNDHHHH